MSTTPPVTDYRECTVDQGRIIGANKDMRVRIGSRIAIVLHNDSFPFSPVQRHEVALDFFSDPTTANGDASQECQLLIVQLFPEYASR